MLSVRDATVSVRFDRLVLRVTGLAVLIGLPLTVACGDSSESPSGPSGEDAPASMTGTVETSSGEPVAGALVGIDGPAGSQDTLTQSGGTFEFQDLEPGHYEVKLTLPSGYSPVGDTVTDVSLSSGQDGSVSFSASAVTSIHDSTVNAGETDTLRTSNGTQVAVTVPDTASDVNVSLEEVPEVPTGNFETASTPVRLSITSTSQTSSGNVQASVQAAETSGSGLVKVTTWIPSEVQDQPENLTLVNSVSLSSTQTTTYSRIESRDRTDGRTGATYSGYQRTTPIKTSPELGLTMEMWLAHEGASCSDDYRRLEQVNGSTLDDRQPLVLIHGWRPERIRCDQYSDGAFDPTVYFQGLIDYIEQETTITSHYKLYTYTYPTIDRVLANADYLKNQLSERGYQSVVLLGHSMGGLVGRGALASDEASRLAGLVTLGTPHDGSELADVTLSENSQEYDLSCVSYVDPQLVSLCLMAETYLNSGWSPFPVTDGYEDLKTTSDLIETLGSSTTVDGLRAIAGVIDRDISSADHWLNVWDHSSAAKYVIGELILASPAGAGEVADGMVPISSAMPDYASGGRSLETYDHSELVSGNVETATSNAYHATRDALGAFIDEPVQVEAGWGSATIDGRLGSEWSNATLVSTQMNRNQKEAAVELRFMNDADSLYVSLRYRVEGTTAGETEFWTLNFNNDADQASIDATEVGDDAASWLQVSDPSVPPIASDDYVADLGSTTSYEPDTSDGGTDDVVIQMDTANGWRTFEFARPLDTQDDSHDMSRGPGDDVGFDTLLMLKDGIGFVWPNLGPELAYATLTLATP